MSTKQHGLFEVLEDRRMFAAYPQSPLVITCTGNNDTILVKQEGDFLKITNNGVTTTHRWKGVQMPGPGPGSPPVTIPGISKLVVNGGYGDDMLLADATVTVPMEFRGGAGSDLLSGGNNNDTIYGGEGGNLGGVEEGSDTIVGRDGNDRIFSNKYGRASVNAGKGNDSLTGGNGNDHLDAGDGNDSVVGGYGNDSILGGAGNDSLIGSWGNDTIRGGDDNDSIYGDFTMDQTEGGDDSLFGDAGKDTINGGAKDDRIDGGAQDDTFIHSTGDDRYAGGTGRDTVSYENALHEVRVQLGGTGANGVAGSENDFIANDIENAIGSPFGDTLIGASGNDQLWGRAGNDSISGMAGNDTLAGEAGEDWINGGAGNDSLYGGLDKDTLITLGGGQTDRAFGNEGNDSFWLDSQLSESSDVTSTELAYGRMHRIGQFANFNSREIEGQRIADPQNWIPSTGYGQTWNYPLFSRNGISKFDVQQQYLGDCGLLSGFASMAESKPWRIKEAVADLGDGTYAVRFKLFGQDMYYRIDNDLPIQADGSLAFAGLGKTPSMWAAILEKAEATLEGAYVSLTSTHPSVPYSRLGGSSFDHWTSDDEDMMYEMAHYLDQGKMITGSTETDLEDDGLIVGNHAYSVLKVNTSTGMVLLYNPWGNDARGGTHQGADDGLVWVSYDVFNACFRDTTVAS